ncbi:MAG: efflux RND transporter periplasmic adaptor subunit [Oscillospiraceae bacterium]|nr:efflux RND transporter periplasmic adaptor subunit [Oscillospiraceae bacterium]
MEQVQKKSKKKRTVIIVVIIVVILIAIIVGVSACFSGLASSLENMTSMMLETTTVEKRDIVNEINVSGSVESENLVNVTSTVTAKIKTLNVELGSHVEEGDVLCEFDSSDLQQQYDSLLKSQNNADQMTQNTHKINQRNLENARTEKEVTLNQAQRGIDESQQARDNAYAKVDSLQQELNDRTAQRDQARAQLEGIEDPMLLEAAEAQYQNAEAAVQNTQASLDALREQLPSYDSAVQNAKDAYASAERSANAAIQSYQDVLDAEAYSSDSSSEDQLQKLADSIEECTVRAPKSGIVTSLNVAEGSIPTAAALMTIEDTDALKITVSIAESDILKIHEGLKAVVKTNATGDEEYSATVTRVVNIYKSSDNPYGMSDSSGGGYSAEITIDDSDTELLIGMNAKVRIILDEKKDVLSVPYEAIGGDEDMGFYVVGVETSDDGVSRAKLLSVEKGMEGSYYTEIISDEATEGSKILMTAGEYEDGEVLPIFDLSSLQNSGESADE